jgi:hypothetical protein
VKKLVYFIFLPTWYLYQIFYRHCRMTGILGGMLNEALGGVLHPAATALHGGC